jgi:hypothetical protein
MYKDKEVNNVNNFFVNVWRKNIFDIYVTEYGTTLTTILPILFQQGGSRALYYPPLKTIKNYRSWNFIWTSTSKSQHYYNCYLKVNRILTVLKKWFIDMAAFVLNYNHLLCEEML